MIITDLLILLMQILRFCKILSDKECIISSDWASLISEAGPGNYENISHVDASVVHSLVRCHACDSHE